ncbi:MAG: HAD-IA family hydrolase [Gemmatimonadota bacterium]
MPLNAMLFDLDGTLLDTNATHAEAWVQGLGKHGYKFSFERIAPEIGKGGDQLLPTLLGEEAAARDGDAIRESVAEAFRKLAATRTFRVFDGALDLLDTLRSRGMRLALATSAGEADLDVMMRSAGVDLRERFDAVVTKSDVERSKPHPDVVRSAIEKLGVSAAQCALVGDTPYDATAARRAGVVTLGVATSTLADEETLRKRLMNAGARRVWRDTAQLLAGLDEALTVASPSRVELTRDRQEEFMRAALDVARDGMENGEAPIGCVLIDADGGIVARGYNEMKSSGNKTAHAEIVAFARAAGKTPLEANDLLLVSTLEPCVMCTGAAMVGAVDTILFALRAPADSGSGRVMPPESPESGMPRIVGDILAEESRALFEEWLADGAEEPQASYGRQLLETTA